VNNLGDEAFSQMKDLDMGDWIGAEGVMMRTKRGQLSVAVSRFTLLSKSIRPLPEKFHGLADKETRYRQRYVDLIVNPDVRTVFEKRSKIISAVRKYMDEELHYYEVETPMLQAIMGGANAKPFVTHHNALDRDFYLRIATELPLKRLLVGGFERVYEIGRVFRNEGMDQYHNPEFTTIEAYQAFSDLRGMMELCEGCFQAAAMAACGTLKVSYQGTEIDLSGHWPRKTMIELATENVGEDVSFNRSLEDLREIATRYHITFDKQWGKGRLIAEIFEESSESKLIQPIFVTDHPLEVSPLAKKKPENPELTDRFELYICGHEYANAFSELNDPVDQAERFQAQVAAKDFDDEAMGYDADYIRALEYGMPPAGGIGIGIDRMVMLLSDAPSIRDVLLFPHMKDEKNADELYAEQKAAAEGAVTSAPVPVATEAADAPAPAAAADRAVAGVAAPAPGQKLEAGITRDEAFELLQAHNKDDFHILHGETLEGLMRYYALQFDPENVEFWGIVGLLHDLDWEEYPNEMDHTVKTAEMLAAAGADPQVARAIQTHNSDLNPALPQPSVKMDCVLYACDELSGLIQACIAVRPSHSVMDFTVKSLKKKYKTASFAAGCDRQVIAHGAELMDMELSELFASVIEAMQAIAPDRDTFDPAAVE
jgi:lysyl-tRNA synthetase class 2